MFDNDPSLRDTFLPRDALLRLPRLRPTAHPTVVADALDALRDDLVDADHGASVPSLALGVFGRLLRSVRGELPDALAGIVETTDADTSAQEVVLLCGQVAAVLRGGSHEEAVKALRRDLTGTSGSAPAWAQEVLADAVEGAAPRSWEALLDVIVEPMLRDADLGSAKDLRLLLGQAEALLDLDPSSDGDRAARLTDADIRDAGPW